MQLVPETIVRWEGTVNNCLVTCGQAKAEHVHHDDGKLYVFVVWNGTERWISESIITSIEEPHFESLASVPTSCARPAAPGCSMTQMYHIACFSAQLERTTAACRNMSHDLAKTRWNKDNSCEWQMNPCLP
jgi:hypothetical protein